MFLGTRLSPDGSQTRGVGSEGETMKSVLAFFAQLLAILRPEARQFQSQRMCPFCGLITPRARRCCLECGKPLRAVPADPKDAKQEG